MDRERLKRQIRQMERELEAMKAAAPAHDSTGLHAMRVMQLEDDLDEKRKALRSGSPDGGATP